MRCIAARFDVILLAYLIFAVGCTRGTPGDPARGASSSIQPDAGHESMLAILEQIKQRAPYEFPFFGRQAQVLARNELNALGPKAGPLQRFGLLRVLGRHELFYEETPKNAIEHLTEAYELFPQIERTRKTSQQHFEAWNETTFHLGVAWLRMGETQNCCSRYGPDSCILPIRGGGIHTNQEGSRQAIKYFQHVLENVESGKSSNRELAVSARWLMNVAYMTLGEYPDQVPPQYLIPESYFQSEVEFPQFKNVAPKLHLNTYNHAGGVAVDDFDNDNYLDIFTCSSDPAAQTRFFHNNRDGTFSERTQEAGLTGLYGGLNLVQADYNNDGNLDVFILRGAWHREFGDRPNSLLRNNGNGTFTDVTFAAGLAEINYPTKTASWADYDNDGDLDLFIGNENSGAVAGLDPFLGDKIGSGFAAPCQLFRNNGDGTFTDVAAAAGVQARVYAMGTVWGDYDNDRFPDLYLGGDSPDDRRNNMLFHNNGDGTFSDVAVRAGLMRPKYSFPVWFWDFNNDGNLDLYISAHQRSVSLLVFDALQAGVEPTEGIVRGTTQTGIPPGADPDSWEFELPGFYRGDGKGQFDDVAAQQNLNYPTEPMGANFGDVNGDGFLDFYLATGNVPYWELRPNVMFLNNRGQGFYNVTMGGGFGHLQKGHGVSFADIDNDGDQDVYVQMGGQLPGDKYYDALFENPGFGNHWITIKLVGQQSNTSAIGARIRVEIIEDGQSRVIYRRVNSGGSFGCNPLRQNIGLGNAERIASLEVYWPTSDSKQTFTEVAMDQAIEITEGESSPNVIELKSFVLGGSVESP